MLAWLYIRLSGKWTKEEISDPGRTNASSCEIEREIPGLLGDTTVVREVLESIIGPQNTDTPNTIGIRSYHTSHDRTT